MNRVATALVIVFSASMVPLKAQETDTLISNTELGELEEFFSFEDSLSIFNMIDSLLTVTAAESKSQIAVRLGYNSNAASNNRTLGISQFGLSPGISYYHKSGIYLDASGYWSAINDPKYYLTILSAGYIGVLSPKWSLLGEYSRYVYSDLGDSVLINYSNSIGISNFLDVKPLTFRLDYTFLFGEKTSHRILPGIMINFEKRNWRNIKRILFYPSFNLMIGSEQITRYVFYDNFLIRSKLNEFLPPDRQIPYWYEEENNEFGIMNYSFTTPISITLDNWNLLISYTYNFPKSLPGQDLGLVNSGYLSASITRYFRMR